MLTRLSSSSSFFAVLVLSFASQCIAQDISRQSIAEIDASGAFAPSGPPIEKPVRIEAGGSCVVDLRQAYEMSGTLSGSLEIDYRIIVYGPCEVPPVFGKYDEEWIAHGNFSGTVNGTPGTGSLSYTAKVKAGGDVEGRIVLGEGLNGELAVFGNFKDGRLLYSGRVK